jgi:hypothetical protein
MKDLGWKHLIASCRFAGEGKFPIESSKIFVSALKACRNKSSAPKYRQKADFIPLAFTRRQLAKI